MSSNLNKKWLYEFEADFYPDKNLKNPIKRKFGILKPSRRLREEGEIYFAAEVSKFAKAGVLPKAAWNTILSDGGGTISEKDREHYGKLLLDFRDLAEQIQSIVIKDEYLNSEEDKEKVKDLSSQMEEIKEEIQKFERSQISIFENTAEARARNKTILWWVLNLFYEISNDTSKLVCDAKSYLDKLDIYDQIEETASEENNQESKFILDLFTRIGFLVTLWFVGKADSQKDFKFYDDEFTNQQKTSSESSKEDDNVEPTAVQEQDAPLENKEENGKLFAPEKINL
jgi:hypothetical protein